MTIPKQLTAIDKKNHATHLHDQHPDWSYADVAKAAHMTEDSVRRMFQWSEHRQEYKRDELRRRVQNLLKRAEDVGVSFEHAPNSDDAMAEFRLLAIRHVERLGPRFVPSTAAYLQLAGELLVSIAEAYTVGGESEEEEDDEEGDGDARAAR